MRGLVTSPQTLVGLILGAAVVFFSGLAINAVTRAAGAIVFEVRRQFREIPGIMEARPKPGTGVVDICTRDSLRELATPGLLAALTPVAVGFGLGIGALAGFLAGAIGAGALMAVFPRTPVVRGTTRRRSSRTGTTVAGAPRRMPRRSSATPSVTPSRTRPVRRSTRSSR